MKNAGISPAIVQEFIGHDSPAINAHYTHIETVDWSKTKGTVEKPSTGIHN
jgi:hypothetical protein